MADWTKLFTFTTVTEVTGEAEHERLEEIEVIFGTYERIDANALWKCKNLQRLAMINCSLTQISNLEVVGESLVHLCLSNQNITKMSGLSTLHQLRHLYLQQNRISRIEGLENCRHLRTLWLYDNCLTAVDNLGYCTDLRELWLQNNKIRSLKVSSGGISELVNLQRLNLAKNRIHDVDEFQYLRKLIVLGQLTFEDENFGSNPIVTHPDYRSLAITTLNQLRQLDGIPIHAEERTTAEDQFFTQTMEFNDQIAELTLAYQQELRSITTRNERGVSHTHTLQQELIQALNDVEACVTAGQSRIQEEKLRQLQLREQHSELLRDNVTKLQEDICASIKEHFEQEEKALQEEERGYEVMELETMAEQNQALAIAALQNAFPTKIAFQQLLQHMPDYRYIAESFRRLTNQQQEAVYATGHLDDREVHILQIYRFLHDDLTATFDARRMEIEADGGDAQGSELYLYLVADDDEVPSLLQHGLVSQTSPEHGDSNNDSSLNRWVFLFSNPVAALQFYKGTIGELEAIGDSDTDDDTPGDKSTAVSPKADCRDKTHHSTPLVEVFNLLLCQVRMNQTIELFRPEKSPLTSLEALHSIASPRGTVLHPPPTAFLQLELEARDLWSGSQSGGHVYIARRDGVHSQVLPQFVLLCSKRGDITSGHPKSEARHNNIEVPRSDLLLTQFQEQLRAEVDAYHLRLYREVDPATVREQSKLQRENEQLRSQLHDYESRIDHERLEQEKLLRSLHGRSRSSQRRK